jgi:hypothetical protein
VNLVEGSSSRFSGKIIIFNELNNLTPRLTIMVINAKSLPLFTYVVGWLSSNKEISAKHVRNENKLLD